jgi:hypothetical protein
MVPIGWVSVVVAVALLGLYLRGLAGRLDRLHLRVEAAQVALDAQLLRRTTLVAELARSGWLDPATSLLLADAASGAQHASAEDRPQAESALTQSLRTVLDEPDVIKELAQDDLGRELLLELAGASDRVILARRFANEAVRQTTEVRTRWLVRVLRLGGHAAMPTGFEMDDAPSRGLARFPGSTT